MTDWSQWVYTPKQHHRYYRGTSPLTLAPSVWSAVEKADGRYRWALFIHGKKPVYGDAATLVSAKRAADRAEVADRLADAADRLAAATAEFNAARAAHRELVAEMRQADGGSGKRRHPKE